jgi:hypothetical protein
VRYSGFHVLGYSIWLFLDLQKFIVCWFFFLKFTCNRRLTKVLCFERQKTQLPGRNDTLRTTSLCIMSALAWIVFGRWIFLLCTGLSILDKVNSIPLKIWCFEKSHSFGKIFFHKLTFFSCTKFHFFFGKFLAWHIFFEYGVFTILSKLATILGIVSNRSKAFNNSILFLKRSIY